MLVISLDCFAASTSARELSRWAKAQSSSAFEITPSCTISRRVRIQLPRFAGWPAPAAHRFVFQLFLRPGTAAQLVETPRGSLICLRLFDLRSEFLIFEPHQHLSLLHRSPFSTPIQATRPMTLRPRQFCDARLRTLKLLAQLPKIRPD